MTSIDEIEHQTQNAIHRWENEGGAIQAYDRSDSTNSGKGREICARNDAERLS